MSGVQLVTTHQARGRIFDIQRYSLHDGPGLRTNVFFKGCRLRCRWCSNPESQQNAAEVAFFEKECFLCGDCLPVCPNGAVQLQDTRLVWERSKCGACARREAPCSAACPSRAFRLIGREATAAEVVAEALRDAAFYGGQGGLTLTGGEPALQPEFAEAVLRLARAEGLHTAIETCGAVRWQNLARLLPYLDLVLFDLKHTDPTRHRQMAGSGNRTILENLRRTAQAAGKPHDFKLAIRVPLIPGFNADEISLASMAAFVQSLPAVREIHLLGYHTLGKAKYRALGRPYEMGDYPPMKLEEAETWAEVFRRAGFEVIVGG